MKRLLLVLVLVSAGLLPSAAARAQTCDTYYWHGSTGPALYAGRYTMFSGGNAGDGSSYIQVHYGMSGSGGLFPPVVSGCYVPRFTVVSWSGTPHTSNTFVAADGIFADRFGGAWVVGSSYTGYGVYWRFVGSGSFSITFDVDFPYAPTATPTSTATNTPTATITPSVTVTPTRTQAWSGLFPTVDVRPLCTLTPTSGPSPTGTFSGRFPTSAWAATNAVSLLASATVDPSRTPGTATPVPGWFQSPTPSLTPSLTLTVTPGRAVGDCRVPVNLENVEPVADIGVGYVLDENGDPVENCYTVIPDIHIEMPQVVRDVVNALTQANTMTVDNTTFHVEQTEICVKYRTISGSILGISLDGLVVLIVSLQLVLWIFATIRREM